MMIQSSVFYFFLKKKEKLKSLRGWKKKLRTNTHNDWKSERARLLKPVF